MVSGVMIDATDVAFVPRFVRFKILKCLMADLYGNIIVNNALHVCNGVQKRQSSLAVEQHKGKDIITPM